MDGNSGKIRYDKIDGLRAFSAIGIVLMHVLANGGYELDGFVFDRLIPSFTDLVFLFMVISGFSMCCGYYDKIANAEITPAQFYSKRIKKVWPFFALLCLLDFAISPSLDSLYETFANLTLCFGLLSEFKFSVIGVGWFLGVVFVFYLLFPFFCFLLSNKRRAWLSFAAALVMNYLCVTYFGVVRRSFVFCAVFFFAGGLIYLYRKALRRFAERYGVLLLLGIGAAAVLYYAAGAYVPIMVVLFGLMTVYGLKPARHQRSVLSNPITKKLSSIGLEIYLSQMVIFRAIEKLGLMHLASSDIVSYVIAVAGTLLGTIIFAYSMQKLISLLSNRMNHSHQE